MTDGDKPRDEFSTPAFGRAALKMCAECPWAKANDGREHPYGWYGREGHLTHLRILRSAKLEACHVTAPDRDVYAFDSVLEDAGFVCPPRNASMRECSGAAVVQLRELRLFEELGSHEAYQKARPAGLPLEALERVRARRDGQAQPPLRAPDIADEDVTDAVTLPGLSLLDYATTEQVNEMQAMLTRMLGTRPRPAVSLAPCECEVCRNHDQVHASAPITVMGESIPVDAGLASLLQAMNDAGVRTVASCQHLREAVQSIAPYRLGELLEPPLGSALHYADTLRRDAGFVRFIIDGPPASRLADLVAARPVLGVQMAHGVVHVDFLPEHLGLFHELVEMIS